MFNRRRRWKDTATDGYLPRRRPWRLGGLIVLAVLLAGLWFAPSIVAHTSLRQKIVSAALSDFEGQVTVDSASLGWLSPLRAYHVTAVDPKGQPLAEVKAVRSERTLLSLLSDRSRPGGLLLEEPRVHLELRGNTSNWEDALAAYLTSPSSSSSVRGVKVDIQGGTLEVDDLAGGQKWQVTGMNASAELVEDAEWPVVVRVEGQLAASPQRRGTIAADVVWRATPDAPAGAGDGQAKVRLEGVPLETVSSAVRRWLGDVSFRGDATGEGLYQWANNAARQNIRLDRITCRDAALRAPAWLGQDVLQSTTLAASGQIEVDGARWQAKEFSLQTDFATLKAQGTLRTDQLASLGSWSAVLDELLQEGTRLSGEVDVARLAAMLPTTLRIRSGTEIKSGRVSVSLASQMADVRTGGSETQPAATAPTLAARLEAMNLTAVADGRRLAWEQPVVVGAKLHRAPDGPVIDELVCQSDFLNVAAQGTFAQGAAGVRGDLTKLASQLGQFVDLQGLKLAGRLDGDLKWQPGAQDAMTAGGKLTLSDFEIAAQDGPPWREQKLVVTLSAAARMAQGRIGRVDSATATLESGADQLRAELLQPVDQPGGDSAWPIQLNAAGDLATWTPRLRPFFSTAGWRLAGAVDLTAKAKLAPTRIDADALKLELTKFRAEGNGVTVDEPLIRLETQAAWDLAARKLTAASATLVSSSVAFRAEQVIVQYPAGVPAVAGAMSYRADLGRLARWTDDPRRPATTRWSGSVTGQIEAKHAANVTEVDWSADVKDLAYTTATAPSGAGRTAAPAAAAWREVWKEPQVKLTGLQRYDHREDALAVERLTGSSEIASFSAAGNIGDFTTRRIAHLDGKAQYDLSKMATRLRPYLGQQITITGVETSEFQLKGPLAAVAAATAGGNAKDTAGAPLVSPELTGSVALGWQSANVYGLVLGPGRLQTQLEGGLLRTLPLDIPVGEGRIKLASQVDLNRAPATLVVAKGPLLDNVSISPELCRGWLKFVAPLLADATAAQGRFTMTLESASIPLADTDQSNVQGNLAIQTAQVGPGPLAQEFLSVAGQIKSLIDGKPLAANLQNQTWLTVPQQDLRFDVKDGRVVHRDFTVTAQDVVIRTSGSVGLDQTLALTAEVPVRDEWIAQRPVLAALKGTSLKIPITGLISKPQLDRRALADFNRQLLRGVGSRMLENELNRGLERLLGPRP